MLTGCYGYMNASVHDRSFDSEFQEHGLITTFGVAHEINESIEVFIQHQSMPFYEEAADGYGCENRECGVKIHNGGQGVNELGFRLKINIF